MPLVNPPLQVQDEGVSQGNVVKLNFAGAGVTAAVSGDTATITIPSGSGLTEAQALARVSIGI